MVIISLTNSPLPPENSRQSVRKGAFVIPAIGASTTGGHTVCGPTESGVKGEPASIVMPPIVPYPPERFSCTV
ncbi:hypothetical protein GCM10009544_19260 [Streptomyces stramineus]|uniref:Uncharacterized protein n=1 Tax=Streptomyces stramineus TaxID=173861 RepID=A0ABN0ZRN1_9ACTN